MVGVNPNEVLVPDLGPPDQLHLVHQRGKIFRVRDLVEPLAPDLSNLLNFVGAKRKIFDDRMIWNLR